jgi:hypothetical protein
MTVREMLEYLVKCDPDMDFKEALNQLDEQLKDEELLKAVHDFEH